jgi:TIR domain
MSFLAPHFDPDVFVSYSHGDPLGDRAPLRDWTRALIRRLNDRLHALETEFDGLKIWMDPDIDPTAYLTPELKAKASASGVLIVVMSKRYLKSSWCSDEREWFQKQSEGRAGDVGRLFVIRAQETDVNLWPEFLRDERGHGIPGFVFYDPDDGTPLSFELREPNDDYFKALGRLQTRLVKGLREMRDREAKHLRDQVTGAILPAPAGPRLIYLHAPPDSESERADLNAALKSDGIVPLTAPASQGTSLADWQREAREIRLEAAKRCEALALLRLESGERFVGDLLDIGVSERERIATARGSPMPCAVLDKAGGNLPIDVGAFGIERFDINRTGWRGEFRQWLDASRVRLSAQAQP